MLAPDAQTLLMRMSLEESSDVRATITVNLIASGDIYGTDAKERLDALMRRGTTATKVCLAEAIARREANGFDDVLIALSAVPEAPVRRAAIAAMAQLVRPAFVRALIERLGEETTRREALQALAGYGEIALPELRAALAATETVSTFRWRIPHAMTILDPHVAGAALLESLPNESEGGVRFQIICALERLVRRTPDLVLDARILEREIDLALARAFRSLDSRVSLARGLEKDPARKTTGHELLRTTLEHKEKNAIERLFRLLGLAHPREDFAQIYRGLNGSREERATSAELIDGILADPVRAAVRGLIDDLPDSDRIRQSGKYHLPLALDYETLLLDLKEDASEVVREVATFHAQELEA